MLAIVILLAIAGAALGYQAAGQRRDRQRYPAPGRLAAAGQSRLHLLEQGNGEPAVVLEAGVAGTLLGWARVQPEIAEFARVLSYDRAGLGWSERASSPRTLTNLLDELAAAVRSSGLKQPIILVGHSFGALLARAYAHRNPNAIAGLVLIDPAGVETWTNCSEGDRRRLGIGVSLSRRGALLARFGVVRFALNLLAGGGRSCPH